MANDTFFNRAFNGMLANRILEPVYTGGAYTDVGQQFTKPTSKIGNLINDVLNFAVGAFADPYSPAGLAYGVKNVIGNRGYNKQLRDDTQLALLNARQQANIARATGISGLPDNNNIFPTFDFETVYKYAMPQQAKNNAVANLPKFMNTGRNIQQSQYQRQPQQYFNNNIKNNSSSPGQIYFNPLPLPDENTQPVNYVSNNGAVLSGGIDYTQPQLFDPNVVDKAISHGIDTVKNAYDHGEKIYSTNENNRNRLQTTAMDNNSREKIAVWNNNSREKIAKNHDNTSMSMNSNNNITRLEIAEKQKNEIKNLTEHYKILTRRLEYADDEAEIQYLKQQLDSIDNMLNQKLRDYYYTDSELGNSNASDTNSGKYIY